MGVSITCSKSEFCNLGRGRGYQYWAFSLGAARIGHCWSSTQPVCLGQGEIMKLVLNWLKQLAEPPAAPGIQSSTQVSCCQWPEQPGWAEVTCVLPGQAQHKAKLQSTAQCQAALGAAPALGQGSSSWHRARTKGSGGSVAAGTAIQTLAGQRNAPPVLCAGYFPEDSSVCRVTRGKEMKLCFGSYRCYLSDRLRPSVSVIDRNNTCLIWKQEPQWLHHALQISNILPGHRCPC